MIYTIKHYLIILVTSINKNVLHVYEDNQKIAIIMDEIEGMNSGDKVVCH